jgi:hypothetical protein
MTTSNQDDQAERRATLENDRRVRQQAEASTYFQQAQHPDIGGRFAVEGTPLIVGSTPQPYGSLPPMPAGNPWSGPDAGLEPPTGVRVDAMFPEHMSATVPVPVATGPASADAPSALPLEPEEQRTDAGPFSSTKSVGLPISSDQTNRDDNDAA